MVEDFLYYSEEVKKSVQLSIYYLNFLRNVDGSSTIEEIGGKFNEILRQLEDEEERVVQESEFKKTAEQKKREAELNKVKQAYFEATGEPLLLNTKDIMESLRSDMQRISQDLRSYNSPAPKWENFLTSKTTKAAWVQGLKDKIQAIKMRNESN